MASIQEELNSVLPDTVNPVPVGDNVIQEKLNNLGITREDYEYLIGPGVKLMEKPTILAKKLKVPLEKAKQIIDTFKSLKTTQHRNISEEDVRKIETCLTESPELSDYEDIALLCEVDQAIVARYFESQPLTNAQRDSIKEKFNSGISIPDISKLVGLSCQKVGEYVEKTFLTFSCDEGKRCLQILEKYTKAPVPKLRELIISENLQFRDEIYKMKTKDSEILKKYFLKFEESKSFFDFDINLSMDDISLINQNPSETVKHLSNRINKVETVIREYLGQYIPNHMVTESCTLNQVNNIRKLVTTFGERQLTLCSYRLIISNSFESMIEEAINKESNTPKDIFHYLLPMTFYYLKCNIPFEDVTQIIANTCKLSLTTHELFHVTFQLSDPVLRGFCIEHYSFNNPVPLYYPKLSTSSLTQTHIKFEFCKELWYSMEQYHGLVSFGLGRAGWNPIGKSSLLDLMFETDFVKGNPQNSAFHFNSIDIQMTKNLFGEKINSDESIKWAYIDCHRHSNTDVIKLISRHLDIALVHITQDDYNNNISSFNREVKQLLGSVKHCYYLVRDYKGNEVKVEEKRRDHLKEKYLFIPDLTKQDTNIHSVRKSLKMIGYEILHLKNPRLVGSEFLEQILKDDSLMDIRSDKRLVKQIIDQVCEHALISDKIEFPFLEYYPLFTIYMCCYYKCFYETCQSTIQNLNLESERLVKKLDKTKMGKIALYLNGIIDRENSSLLLWKLSQELSLLSKQHSLIDNSAHQQKYVRYSLEIFWREALLSTKYGQLSEEGNARDNFITDFSSRYSSYVGRGEPFELIDGDNLRYFDREIDDLLLDLYQKQEMELDILNEGKQTKIKQAPIVVSIFGPQSSGKSTLLNYCFGCKFLTSAGRCTRGIYASLAQLSRPVNLTNQFLILDTEGLDGIERANFRDTSLIHFDRTMVLFCLAVSQVVIINVKGDIGNELQNLLQICTYSLNKLNVRKVAAPKIFFVLNQQADPDPDKHLDSINILLDKLNGDLMDTEAVKISGLIQVSRENLFILPCAFNSEQMNKPGSKLFDSEVIKLSPTVTFADKCTKLRLAIIEQLDNMPVDDRTPFQTMKEWMEMSGIIWDTIVRYQDIVKYRNVDELMCNNELSKLVSELVEEHIYRHKQKFLETTNQLSIEIQEIEIMTHLESLLTKCMIKFDEIFIPHQEDCNKAFTEHCEANILLKKNSRLCEESKSNLSRLIYIEKKIYEDKLKFQIKAVSVEILSCGNMKKFQDAITRNVDYYLQLDHTQQREAFEQIWAKCFGGDDGKEVADERDETFGSLYSIFRMESNTMQNKQDIYFLFASQGFEMELIIPDIKSTILVRFMNDPNSFDGIDQFIFPCNRNDYDIRYMTPYGGRRDYEYLSGSSLFQMAKKSRLERKTLILSEWVPLECRPLVKYCSGHYRHPDVNWGSLDRKQQVLGLVCQLRSPRNLEENTWQILLSDICEHISDFIHNDPNISHGIVKRMVNYLSTLFKLVNYEINCIQAKLSDTAQRTITTLVFSLAYQSLWNIKIEKRKEQHAKSEVRKMALFEYFSQKIETRKIIRGDWNREKMKESDLNISKKFALDFLESVKRGLFITEQPIIELYFDAKKEILSYENILLTGNIGLISELEENPEIEVLDQDNFAIRYICDRNTESMKIFLELWDRVQNELHLFFASEMNGKFCEQIQLVKQVLIALQDSLVESSAKSGTSEHKAWDSDNNFEIADLGEGEEIPLEMRKESPFKAMVLYLQMYLNPMILPAVFQDAFKQGNILNVDGVNVKLADTYVLCDKPVYPVHILSEEMFKKLLNTKMFSSENIFNLYDYVTEFLSFLNKYTFEVTVEEFSDLVQHIKQNFEIHAIGCPNQCPSCGKNCERELHPNDGLCQIKTGHQLCSMGGEVWNNDEDHTALLLMCDDFKEHTNVSLPGESVNWLVFMVDYSHDWYWSLPEDETSKILQYGNKVKMRDIWNKFGRGILYYYAERGTHITYVPYTSLSEVYKILEVQFYICFVIDGTMSMLTEIKKVRISVGQIIRKFKQRGKLTRFKVVIYRDHCDKVLLEKYPKDNEFTPDYLGVQTFLNSVEAYGGLDFPEAALDGLATAATHSEWKTSLGIKNIIIHIFDAPPHGAFPDPTVHDSRSHKKHCCCCNHGSICPFDWKTDVWGSIKKNKIQYYGINTGERVKSFEAAMKANLEELCGEFQTVGKEVVNDAILDIFIDHKSTF